MPTRREDCTTGTLLKKGQLAQRWEDTKVLGIYVVMQLSPTTYILQELAPNISLRMEIHVGYFFKLLASERSERA